MPSTNRSGSANNDSITGSTSNDTISGLGGNDWIDGSGGNDFIYGDSGNDTLVGGYGDDNIFGGAGDDTYFASTTYNSIGSDTFDGGNGLDEINLVIDPSISAGFDVNLTTGLVSQSDYVTGQLIGNDPLHPQVIRVNGARIRLVSVEKVTGSMNSDTISGSQFSDIVKGNDGNETVNLNFGNDSFLDAGYGADTLDGGEGIDRVTFYSILTDSNGLYLNLSNISPNTITTISTWHGSVAFKNFEIFEGTLQRDTMIGGNGVDNFYGSYGNDHITMAGGADYASGDSGNDSIQGGDDADTLDGGEGEDSVFGEAGNDSLLGGIGNDILNGGADHDSIFGGLNNDYLDGESGNDFISGDAGNDTILAGEGDDTLLGGGGIDTLNMIFAISAIAVDLRRATRQIIGGGYGNDVILGFENILGSNFSDSILGNDFSNSINGGNGDDIIAGYSSADSLIGGDGHDEIDGGDDNDLIMGGIGNDSLTGGNGNDSIYGDTGTDIAIYNYADANAIIYQKYDSALHSNTFYVLNRTDASQDTLYQIESLKFKTDYSTSIYSILSNNQAIYDETNFGKIDNSSLVIAGYYDQEESSNLNNINISSIPLIDGVNLRFNKFIGYAKPGFGMFDSNVAEKSWSNKLDSKLTADFGYYVGFKAGVMLDFDINLGEVNAQIDPSITWTYLRRGDSVTVNSNFSESETSFFNTESPYMKMIAKAGIFSPNNWFGIKAPVLGLQKIPVDLSQDFYTLVDFDSRELPSYEINENYFDASVHLPDLSGNSHLSNGKLVSSVTSNIGSVDVDIDALATSIIGWPNGLGIHKTFDLPGLDAYLDANILDVNLNFDLNLHQDVSLDLTGLTGTLFMEDGSRIAYRPNTDYSWSYTKYDVDRDGQIEFTYDLVPKISITNHTYLTVDAGLDIEVGTYSVGIDVATDGYDFGSPWEDRIYSYNTDPLELAKFPLYDQNNKFFTMANITGSVDLGDYGIS